MENSIMFPQKSKMELPYNPAIPYLGMYPKKMKSLYHRDICTLMFMVALFVTVMEKS